MRPNQSRIILGLTLILATILSGKTLAAPSLNIKITAISDFQNNEPSYMMLITMNDLNVAKYRIERQSLDQKTDHVQIAELTYAEMKRISFHYFDLVGLKKHGHYRYFVSTLDAEGQTLETATMDGVVENIRYKCDMQQFLPVFTQNNATFTLGPKIDPENETLEYRLYIRLPGGGGEKVLQAWRPQRDNEKVVIDIWETCEWKLSCIEIDPTIPDRVEVVLVNWSLFTMKF